MEKAQKIKLYRQIFIRAEKIFQGQMPPPLFYRDFSYYQGEGFKYLGHVTVRFLKLAADKSDNYCFWTIKFFVLIKFVRLFFVVSFNLWERERKRKQLLKNADPEFEASCVLGEYFLEEVCN